MKKLLFLLLIPLVLLSVAGCKKDMEVIDIHTVNYQVASSGDGITDIQFMDADNGVMNIGDYFYFTYDGGRTWVNEFYLNNYDLICYSRPTLDTAYTFWQYSSASAIKCYRTVDGGVTWIQVSTMGETCAASFYTGSRGLAISEVNNNVYNVWRSNTSGQNWNMPYVSPFMNKFIAFDALNFFGYVQGGTVYKTSDGGLNIDNVFSGNGCLDLVMLPSVQRGFILDESGDIYSSTDFGSTWTRCFHDSGGARISYLDAHESGLVVAAGYGPILISKDFGATWNYYDFNGTTEMSAFRFYCLDVIDANTFYVSARNPEPWREFYHVTVP